MGFYGVGNLKLEKARKKVKGIGTVLLKLQRVT